MTIELALAIVAGVGWLLALSAWRLARRWSEACKRCRIIIARKGKVALDASLVEWIAWNEALPKRERNRGGVIFAANGVQVALGRPKIGPAVTSQKTRTVKTPAPASS